MINWGILGTGRIAQLFAADIILAPGANLIAVASRTAATAEEFGRRFRIPYRYGSYAELANDPRVQAVYIATPASVHQENMLLCLAAGKAVLCEKPFTINSREAEEVVALARARKVFLMEAMWTRFLPLMAKLRQLLAAGVIGEVSEFIADLGTPTNDLDQRTFKPELGGGALLQKGVYLLSLAAMILGTPRGVKSIKIVGSTGVDEHTAFILSYAGPQLASLICSVRVQSQRQATIVGSTGRISIHEPVTCPSALTVFNYPPGHRRHDPDKPAGVSQGRSAIMGYCRRQPLLRRLRERYPKLSDRLVHGIRRRTIYAPPAGTGLHYQVAEVMRCLQEEQLESTIMPLAETLSIMRTLDQVQSEA
jgi:predicted dehydrogenase